MSVVTALYLLAIVAANLITASTHPLVLGAFSVTWGTWLIGANLLLRDFVQLRHGRTIAYAAIVTALALSAVLSIALHDPLAITAASALSFALSETAETELFSRYRSSLARRILVSGTTASLLDSVAFVLLGLSPLTTGFVPWVAVPGAIVAQYVVKTGLMALGATTSRQLRARLA